MVEGIGTSIRGEHMSEASKALARRLWDVWHSRDLDKLGDLSPKVTSIMIQTTRLIWLESKATAS